MQLVILDSDNVVKTLKQRLAYLSLDKKYNYETIIIAMLELLCFKDTGYGNVLEYIDDTRLELDELYSDNDICIVTSAITDFSNSLMICLEANEVYDSNGYLFYTFHDLVNDDIVLKKI